MRVKEALSSISSNTQKGMHILTAALISNYLSNISSLNAQESSLKSQPESFKEVIGLVNIISILSAKHHHLKALLAFQKNDYSDILTLYQSKIPFLNSMSPTTFASMTFLECLAAIRYFSIHGQASLILIEALIDGYTGFTFLNAQSPQEILDLTHLVTIEVLSLLKNDSEAVLSRPNSENKLVGEKYLSLINTIHGLACVWKNISATDMKTSGFGRKFKKAYLSLIKQIICSFQFVHKDIYAILGSYGEIDYYISIQLSLYHQLQLKQRPVTELELNKMKQKNYKDFLFHKEDLPELDIDKNYADTIKAIKIAQSSNRENQSKHYTASKTDAELLRGRCFSILCLLT